MVADGSVYATRTKLPPALGRTSMLDEQPQTESRVARRAPAPPTAPPHSAASLNALPGYTRSLLKIKVPVVVTLAQKKQSLRRILELAPGAIIQFDKSCDEMLQLAVGHRLLAQGQAVKVGEKFGLCVTSIILPEERFKPVRPQSG
jgi:flagellar motor switch protein FliN